MRLKKIIENLNIKKMYNFKNFNIKSITHVSNDVIVDSMFLCIKGNNFDGNSFIDEAIKNGAKCIVTDCGTLSHNNVCIIVVDDVRKAMSIIAKNFYNRCIDSMRVVGVVGTSGKTTTTLMIAQLLINNGKKIGVIGTNGIYIDNIRQENLFTTPDPLELHYIFYQMKMLGVDIVVMEVSAQAIFYNKVYGVYFDVCVFTNISEEHLDFFGSFENYAKVKMDFFNKKNMKECVVNIDDFYGRELAYKLDFPRVSYGINEPSNVFAIDVEFDLTETRFVANILDDVVNVKMPFVGLYNVYNMLASLTVVRFLGLSKSEIEYSLSELKEIDGRFNVYEYRGKKIIIDFAHTPDSVEKLLTHIRNYSSSNIISLFGCVGYSDKEKRIKMGEVVSKYSDQIILTTDNRGNTPFEDICRDVLIGIGDNQYICIEDRCKAIEHGVKLLNNNDILVLIGKGAEDFQKINDQRVPYSDKDSLMKILKGIDDEGRVD